MSLWILRYRKRNKYFNFFQCFLESLWGCKQGKVGKKRSSMPKIQFKNETIFDMNTRK